MANPSLERELKKIPFQVCALRPPAAPAPQPNRLIRSGSSSSTDSNVLQMARKYEQKASNKRPRTDSTSSLQSEMDQFAHWNSLLK